MTWKIFLKYLLSISKHSNYNKVSKQQQQHKDNDFYYHWYFSISMTTIKKIHCRLLVPWKSWPTQRVVYIFILQNSTKIKACKYFVVINAARVLHSVSRPGGHNLWINYQIFRLFFKCVVCMWAPTGTFAIGLDWPWTFRIETSLKKPALKTLRQSK